MACECNYTYICNECEEKHRIFRQQKYNEEMFDWVVQSIVAVAKKFDVDIKDPPSKPEYQLDGGRQVAQNSSNGPIVQRSGHGPFKAVTPVQIRLGSPINAALADVVIASV